MSQSVGPHTPTEDASGDGVNAGEGTEEGVNEEKGACHPHTPEESPPVTSPAPTNASYLPSPRQEHTPRKILTPSDESPSRRGEEPGRGTPTHSLSPHPHTPPFSPPQEEEEEEEPVSDEEGSGRGESASPQRKRRRKESSRSRSKEQLKIDNLRHKVCSM